MTIHCAWVRIVLMALIGLLMLPVLGVPAAAQEPTGFVFERVDECFVDLPYGYGVRDGTACGYVTVPENWDNPANSHMIRIAVVVFHPRSGETRPDPVMILDGGPGIAVMHALSYTFNLFVKPGLDTHRSVILFAQRGIAPCEPVIEPAPQCHPVQAAQRAYDNATNQTTREAYHAAWAACFGTFAGTADLSGYHASAIAADANAIRQALGIVQVNLWGYSYGGRVGLTLLRDFPGSVRSAMLDGPMTLVGQLTPEMMFPMVTAHALEALFDACASDAECRAIAPDLRATFFETAAALNAEPVIVSGALAGSGELAPLVIDGRRFAALLPVGASSVLRYIPRLIVEASEGRFVDALQALVGDQWRSVYAPILVELARCNEEGAVFTLDELSAAVETVPDYASFLYPVWDMYDCRTLGEFRTLPPVEREPLASDIPVLLLAGEFDPLTTAGYAERIAADLNHAFLFTVPYAGHSLLPFGRCLDGIRQAFLADPMTPPDTGCFSDLERSFSWASTLPAP